MDTSCGRVLTPRHIFSRRSVSPLELESSNSCDWLYGRIRNAGYSFVDHFHYTFFSLFITQATPQVLYNETYCVGCIYRLWNAKYSLSLKLKLEINALGGQEYGNENGQEILV